MSERVLSHFKAVQKFLGELPENMREKMASEQCSRLLQALSDMPRLDFHTLASLAQTVKETNFSEGEKEQLVSSMSKLAGSSDAEVKSGRRVLQNYTSFPALMLKADYAKIQSPDMKHGERLDYLIDWLGRCGLRCPTEMSMAMITAVFQLSVGGARACRSATLSVSHRQGKGEGWACQATSLLGALGRSADHGF